ncbi:hypothetical protein BH11MYX1_BH11MYX1_57350 [soil metagenome]
MKTFSLIMLALAGCTDYGQATLAVSHPPIKSSSTSALEVPTRCPIYSPGGGDVDTVEEAYSKPYAFGCGVAASHNAEPTTFGMVTGDTANGQLAKLPGDREIGIFRPAECRGAPRCATRDREALAAAMAAGVNDPCIDLTREALGRTGPRRQQERRLRRLREVERIQHRTTATVARVRIGL